MRRKNLAVIICVTLFVTIAVFLLLAPLTIRNRMKMRGDSSVYPISHHQKTEEATYEQVYIVKEQNKRKSIKPSKPRNEKGKRTIEEVMEAEYGVFGPDEYRIKVIDAETGTPLSGIYAVPKTTYIQVMLDIDNLSNELRKQSLISQFINEPGYPPRFKAFDSEFIITRPSLCKLFYTVILVEGYEPVGLELGVSKRNAGIRDVEELTVEMRKGTAIEGRVVTKDGRGIPYATMYFWQKEPFDFLRVIYTDKDGYFKLTEVPYSSRYNIRVFYFPSDATPREWLKEYEDSSTRISDYKPDGKFIEILLPSAAMFKEYQKAINEGREIPPEVADVLFNTPNIRKIDSKPNR